MQKTSFARVSLLLCSTVITGLTFQSCTMRQVTKSPEPWTIRTCLSGVPEDVKGLNVRGPRPRRNIIENMTPIICQWRSQCTGRNQDSVSGVIDLTLSINHVGEPGIVRYTHTLKDSAFVANLLNEIYLHDFDPWNDRQEPTEFDYPVRLVGSD